MNNDVEVLDDDPSSYTIVDLQAALARFHHAAKEIELICRDLPSEQVNMAYQRLFRRGSDLKRLIAKVARAEIADEKLREEVLRATSEF